MATENMNREAADILTKVGRVLDKATITVDVDAIHGIGTLLHRFGALVGAIEEDMVIVERRIPDEEVLEETFGPMEDYV